MNPICVNPRHLLAIEAHCLPQIKQKPQKKIVFDMRKISATKY
jgi:hypothetical protein